jgi:hypothetical protein
MLTNTQIRNKQIGQRYSSKGDMSAYRCEQLGSILSADYQKEKKKKSSPLPHKIHRFESRKKLFVGILSRFGCYCQRKS